MDEPGRAPGGGEGKPVFRSLGRRRRPTGPPWGLIGGLVLLALVAAGIWYWFQVRPDEDPAPGEPVEAVEPAPEDPVPAVAPIDLPELDASDAIVREMVQALSAHPRLAEWLVTEDLARRYVTAVVNIAVGGAPAEHLRFMAPEGAFQVEQTETGLVVAPASWDRYDPAVDAFISLPTGEAARLYRQLHPLFEQAYDELGLPDRTFDETLAVAMGNLLAVDVPDPPVEVEPSEAVYVYVDPELEALTPAEKHLLRLGPENARAVQAKLRALADALGLEPRSAAEIGGGGAG